MNDTIFALSSGQPPAGIAVIRISGPSAAHALATLAGKMPLARRASFARLRDADGAPLDDALVLWLPGPGTATGEDIAELHLHGGRAVVRAVELALARIEGLRSADAGEFTRRAFANGRIDLAEAEGLADLLSAETELQRRSALAMAGGTLSRQVESWRANLLMLGARVEAVLDFADEDDVAALPADFNLQLDVLAGEIATWLDRPHAEVLKDGFRVVLAGPPNAGKSTLFNALVESDAAITAPTAGTTRDVITRPVALDGVPFIFVDTAGLHEGSEDAIEMIGIGRAHVELDRADLVLWLGPEGAGPNGAWEIEAQIDRVGHSAKQSASHRLSAVNGEGLDKLRHALVATARKAMPKPGEAALNTRQRELVSATYEGLVGARGEFDPLIIAEHLRIARVALDRLVGRATTEDMLDALFGRFCIGK
ncbi:tRNA uridine-5-carboxymethylaminomethyl(34) synthesis GTPase MnmE [Caenibius tardaugens]|uniref:tRNA uridine-5-carboxymethylaminomethyl(34) synthesis GTPase MnmE n=1 Tax=Caenibius tardaugens TaxID=169176 RepID=UPI0004073F40|nr:tRNA uridine-5-carboxymethylaminomethyl(34) synthesis GTPase MnmE [Caenibius tardaugens]AZI35999.1 tRNA uridine-5-carboxymethylaminomethyl(34) synthesis GTPase MnmE [Caenibius tardaugens NBRC 16725]